MKELQADIFELPKDGEAICITTNGIVKSNGLAVMGAGIAKDARERYKGIDKRLGDKLSRRGNHVFCLGVSKKDGDNVGYYVMSFPTKSHWKDKSDISLIKQSCYEVVELCNEKNISKCYIPRPGCNNGKLNWESDVRPIISQILDDRFVIVNKL